MSILRTRRERLEHLIETMDRPLLVLALVTVCLYLLDLENLLGAARPAYQFLTVIIDFIFVFDLVLKIRTLGTGYFRTPWFLIDLLSCLPVFDVLANRILPLRAIRFVRVFRILRILRTLRVLRALRSIPAFEQLVMESPGNATSDRTHRNMNIAMVVLTILLLVLISVARKQAELRYFHQVEKAIESGLSLRALQTLGARLKPPADGNFVTRTAEFNGRGVLLYFDLADVDRRADEGEFFLIMGMILTIFFFMYIMTYYHTDITQTQLRALLNLALPRQVAERFMVDPSAYDQRSRTPATIMFMDFVGFTQACEALADYPDRLSSHLEQAMDRLVGELVKHDLIIDKFIGDAVMSFRGGPLVSGGPCDHAYRTVRAALDSTKALRALCDPYFNRVKIGGASSDDCLIGAFGTSARLSYTILGDAVNVAARLEPASAQCGTRNLFCETTYQLCADRADLVWRRWGQIRVAGRSIPIMVFEAFDASDDDWTFITTFHRALEAFERGDFDRARDLFLLADSQRLEGDEPSRGYAAWCENLILEGPPAGWEPVFVTHK